MLLSKDFTFDSAHFLTEYHGKCEHLHGHTYKLRVTVEGKVQSNGLLIDFGILKKIVKEQILDKYDHRCLNDFFDNPTAENVVMEFWKLLEDLPSLLKAEANDPNLPEEIKRLLKDEGSKDINEEVRLYELSLWETPNSFVTYRGE